MPFCVAQYDQLVGSVYLLCGDLGVAEALTQSALEKAWSRWGRVSAMDSPGGWVQQVAFNLARSRFRRQAAECRAIKRHGPDDPTRPVDSAAVITVREALLQLSARQREVVIHRYFMGRSVAQTAAAMGLSQTAAKQLSYRARQRLRELLPDEAVTSEHGTQEGGQDG
ncbi:SigE family RNA polymerase sigma factor [soil metagenome]